MALHQVTLSFLIPRLLSMAAGFSTPLQYYYKLTENEAAHLLCGWGTMLVVGHITYLLTKEKKDLVPSLINLHHPIGPYAAL